MLLNYLYANFLEESRFAAFAGTSPQEIQALVQARVFPAHSYTFESRGRSISFVDDRTDEASYRFHLRSHVQWFQTVQRLGLTTERRARRHFFDRYSQAKEVFLTSQLGLELCRAAPDIPAQFDTARDDQTWKNFLDGVYGVCTRDGQPETVFLKQAGVMFIDQMISEKPGSFAASRLQLLHQAVGLLDRVAAEFAPHEVPRSSRQRCIIDVKARFPNLPAT